MFGNLLFFLSFSSISANDWTGVDDDDNDDENENENENKN